MIQPKYETVQAAAERLGVTVRAVQKWAKEGKIFGAQKVGRDWQIPADAYHPGTTALINAEGQRVVTGFPLPLINAAFTPGEAQAFVDSMEHEDERVLAQGELLYFSGHPEEAAALLSPYLDSHVPWQRLSAEIVCTFAYLSLDRLHLAQFSIDRLRDQVNEDLRGESTAELRAIRVFVATLVATELHFPLDQIPPLDEHLHYLPEGLRLFGCYVLAHIAYLRREYERALGIAQAALNFVSQVHPLPKIYMHLISAACRMSLRQVEPAKRHMAAAWDLAKPDGLVAPFGEFHNLLQGLVELQFKNDQEAPIRRVMEVTRHYGKGWREMHNRIADRHVTQVLTPTEFTVAMLYHRGWRAREIAEHMELAERTVKNYLQIVYEKLQINGKRELEQYMMQ